MSASAPQVQERTKKPRAKRQFVITDGQRRKWRTILMLVALPFALFGLVTAVKFISAEISANAAVTAYSNRAYKESAQQTEPLFWWNFYEQWKAPYDKGTALGMAGLHDDAIEQLDAALELEGSPGSEAHCIIYTNKIYVLERKGDELRKAGDKQGANEAYKQALQLIEGADPACSAPPEERATNIPEQLAESKPRIEEKIDEEENGGGDGEDENDEQNQEGGGEDDNLTEQEKELKERQREAEEERQRQEQYRDGTEEEGGGNGVEKPW